MATSRWSMFVNRMNRSSQRLRDGTAHVLRMDGVEGPSRAPKSLLSFNTRDDINDLAVGCDADIGGTSSARLDFILDSPDDPSGKGKGKFWGEMKLGLRGNSNAQGRTMRSGYAGFRSKRRPTLFGELTDDISNHEFLALRLRVAGHPRTHNSYFVNVQTDAPVSGELWQHRLYFRNNDGSWEDIFIPFSAFALTSYGELTDSSVTMEGERIRWLGISILGGNAGVEGPFELGLDSIKAVNKEDVTLPIHHDGNDFHAGAESSDGTPWERGPR
ncbi:CIA30-domain-containing protein [Schizopora paradoxa]|uniref:CIA30-domain-containing protein n=1 Tax=Schizopora paradoxa TaxID=27342 RepID=A0A0H2S872_9AGAM|nr:CIA30-domain-containing protein [Schizopora paradoxa]